MTSSRNISPISIKWEIRRTWRGRFRYPLRETGHYWYYAAPTSWRLWNNHQDTPTKSSARGISLAERASQLLTSPVFPSLPPEFQKIVNYPFARWLSNEHRRKLPVTAGLSLILNSLLVNLTLKPTRIITTITGEHVTFHIRGLPAAEPCWSYICDNEFLPRYCDEHFLIAPEELFRVSKTHTIKSAIRCTDFRQRVERLKHVRILHEFTVSQISVSDSAINLQLQDNLTMVEYQKGRLCGCIPIPGKEKSNGTEPYDVRTREVVATSSAVRDALLLLNHVWQDRSERKSVLISAPPGSGKEGFCESIVYGNGRSGSNFSSVSLATSDYENMERQLFGYQDGSVTRPGLIAKAAKSGLFLDEVHQPENLNNTSPVRAALLRPLESGDFVPKGALEPHRVDNVIFILATSKHLDELHKYNPVDFWTRMTHVIRIEHPLDIPSGNHDELRVCAHFFNFFWIDHLDNLLASRKSDDCDQGRPSTLLEWQRNSLSQFLLAPKWGDGHTPGTRFAAMLFAILEERDIAIVSISLRGIRNMVSRLFYIGAAQVSRGERFVLP